MPESASIADYDSGYPIPIKVQCLIDSDEFLSKEEIMGNEGSWNTFARTGRVSDYLAYVGDQRQREQTFSWGNGAFGSYHW